ncbi:MAG: endonuclease domain-containing protein [Sphingopyxis solisilvae]|uniref:endonuclease domain-containing protein n=1 Tax=Sphingopyxis solisilvae TaxID=1886788 RepID=UPI00403590D3
MTDVLARKALLLERARAMRSNPTDAERRLWSILRAKRLTDLRWRRQEIIDDLYIADFICFEYRLIVEADGGQHADNVYDADRDAYLTAQGFRIIRFWNNDVLTNSDGVAEAILHAIDASGAQTRADPTPQPLSRKGRGAFEGAHNG